MVESINEVDKEIEKVNPELSQKIHEAAAEGKIGRNEANQVETSIE